ncbi:MAG: type II secretion system protein [Candidatus Omnitrophica bacterium]|nr:type II secretion system protein [Candidatus Omnitrophota bacterium]
MKRNNNNAFTLVEMLLATACAVVLMVGVFNYNNILRTAFRLGLAGQVLQDGANIIVARIIQGAIEPGGIYRLSQGVSYCIGSGARPASCSTPDAAQLHYWGTDGVERWYYLNESRTAFIYHHPTPLSPGGDDEILYHAPVGATITLYFWPLAASNKDVGVSVALVQNIFGSPVTGSLTTLVNLRNHP